MKKIEITVENAQNAYRNASADGKELLEHLLGKELFIPKDIKERIKTFEDACNELNRMAEKGDETAANLLADYESNSNNILVKQTLATMKLSIIAYALNEGWEPQFTEDENRYYPWFYLYTQEEIEKMDEEERGRVLGRSDHYAKAFAGVASSDTYVASSNSNANFGVRLCFKTRELAEYAGRQFLAIYVDFIMFTK